MNKNINFEKRMRLIFPHYVDESGVMDQGKQCKILSENQLEHIIKLCNIYGKSVRSLNDHHISAYKGINILLDFTYFNQIKKINVNTQKCKLEPGTTFKDLNHQLEAYNFYVPYVVPDLNEKVEEIQIDQAVQENRLCLQSLKYGMFKDQALERVSFVSGEGRMIQTGGYKVRDTFSFGYNINDLFAGSNYTIGLLFEAVVNCFKQRPNRKGKEFHLKMADASQLPQIISNFKEYIQYKEDHEQSLVDGIIISNINEADLKNISLTAFDFSLTCEQQMRDFSSRADKDTNGIISKDEQDTVLDINFVSKFTYSSLNNHAADQELLLVIPLESGFSFLQDYREAFETFPFQMHLLKRYIAIKLCFDSTNEQQLIYLDKLTSQVIKKGGTLKASRKVLYMISPYLDKRIIGNYNMKIHNGLKQLYDPKDVLNPSSFFYLREKYEKSIIQKMKDKNKQDLLQNKFSSEHGAHYIQLRNPISPPSQSSRGRASLGIPSKEMISTIAMIGDPKKNSDKLKFLLMKIKFPQAYDEQEAMTGHPTQFMKILNYTLFVASVSVRNYLFDKGVDPDTVYLNDFKFMQRVFHILFKIFGYKPCLTLDQFFKYGFVEQKIILCCDAINLVKKAGRDLQVQRSLSRKRSQTTRTLSVGRYSIVDHSREEKKSFHYERDTVNKVAKVTELTSNLQTMKEAERSDLHASIVNARMRSKVASSRGSSSQSRKYAFTQSRYKLPPRETLKHNCHSGAHIESQSQRVSISQTGKSLEFQPLRSIKKPQEEKYDTAKFQEEPIVQPPSVREQPQPVNLQPEASQNENLIIMLKQTIDSLNNKFDSFQRTIDTKIDSIHKDYEHLSHKLNTIQAQRSDQVSQATAHDLHRVGVDNFEMMKSSHQRGFGELKERGDFASPYQMSEVHKNPFKEFTLGEKSGADAFRQMYSTDGFQSKDTRQDLRDESRELINNIRKNLDESKYAISKYITIDDNFSAQN